MSSPYTLRKVGTPFTLEHRVYIEKDGIPISPFHDIPLYANAEQTILNMVVEIPRWTNAKQEVSQLQLFWIATFYVGASSHSISGVGWDRSRTAGGDCPPTKQSYSNSVSVDLQG